MRNDLNAVLTFDAVVENVHELCLDKRSKIIDVGCGDGQLLERLKDMGYQSLMGAGYAVREIDGIRMSNDIDLSASGWAKKLNREAFDLVVSTDVIEHLVNPYQFLVEIRNLLSPKGTLILTFPNVHNLRSIIGYGITGRYSGFFGKNFNNGHPLHDQHIFIPNIHLLRYLLKLVDYKINSINYINGKNRLFSQTTIINAKRFKS